MERKKPYVNEQVVFGNEDICRKQKKCRRLLELAALVLIFTFFVYFLPTYIVERIPVSGPSMEDTLYDRDHVLVEKISMKFKKIKRFDVVVFQILEEDGMEYYIKRVIGLPGETIRIADNAIYINGQPLFEDYGNTPLFNAGQMSEEKRIGDDEYFVLGDNREISLDSRYEHIGMVEEDQLVGRAFFIAWPMKRIGEVD